MEILKGQILESKQEEFQCVLLAKISSVLELCNITKSLLTGGFSNETITCSGLINDLLNFHCLYI